MLGRSVNLSTLFLGRLRPPKRLTSGSSTNFRQKLTTALLESAEGETKVCGQTEYQTRTPDLRVRCPTECAMRPGFKIVKELYSMQVEFVKIYQASRL